MSRPVRRSWSASCPLAELLGEIVRGPIVVDNDVNWTARAERDAAEIAGEAWAGVVTCTSAKGSAAPSSAT